MEVFKWRENAKTLFGRSINTKEGNNKLYSPLTDKYDLLMNMKLKGTKGEDKPHNTQEGIINLEPNRSLFCGI